MAEGKRLDDGDLGANPSPVLGHREHHLGNAMAARLTGEALNQRAVQQPAEHRHDEQEPDSKPRKMTARHVLLLAELLVAGRQPREAVDQPPERDGSKTRTRADDERHHRQAESGARQPRRYRRDRFGACCLTGRRRYGLGSCPRRAVGVLALEPSRDACELCAGSSTFTRFSVERHLPAEMPAGVYKRRQVRSPLILGARIRHPVSFDRQDASLDERDGRATAVGPQGYAGMLVGDL
ncbi:MAG TPA: hypothetical protein VGF91_32895 [Solirubrobacteraceae bacterium]